MHIFWKTVQKLSKYLTSNRFRLFRIKVQNGNIPQADSGSALPVVQPAVMMTEQKLSQTAEELNSVRTVVQNLVNISLKSPNWTENILFGNEVKKYERFHK